jgi:hypothetical protein
VSRIGRASKSFLAKISITSAAILAPAGFVFVLLAALLVELLPEDRNYPKIDFVDALVGVLIFGVVWASIVLGIDVRRCIRVGVTDLRVARGFRTRTFPWPDVLGASLERSSLRLNVISRGGVTHHLWVTRLHLPGGEDAIAKLESAWSARLTLGRR